VRDIENLTAKCTITMPKRVTWAGEISIPIKRGDRVLVQLGYDYDYEMAFTGYISKITAKTPITIECEDEMWRLKQTTAKKKTYTHADLKNILAEQCPKGMNIEVFGKQVIDKYVANFDTVAQLLGGLQENGFTFFFKHGTLYGGMMFDYNEPLSGKKQVFHCGERGNIIDDKDLAWAESDSILARIKATAINGKGKKDRIQIEIGDKEGNLGSFTRLNVSKEQLEKEAKQRLAEIKKTGLSGSFTTFGARLVWLLDLVKIKTIEHPEGAVYKVRKNTITFGENGYRQNITIGGKAK
jgi:translation initiation factor IF-1